MRKKPRSECRPAAVGGVHEPLRICVIVCVGWGGVFSRCHVAQAEKRISDEKTRASSYILPHDVRTPLTLIEAPLEEWWRRHGEGGGWTMYGWP